MENEELQEMTTEAAAEQPEAEEQTTEQPADGQAEEQAAEQRSNADGGEEPEASGEEAEAEEPEEETFPPTIPVRVGDEERALTAEEASRYAQLGLQSEETYTRIQRIAAGFGKSATQMLDDLENAGREQLYNRLLEECGGNEEIARRLLTVEMNERNAAYERQQTEAREADKTAHQRQQERLAEGLREVMEEFPEEIRKAADVPKSVYADAMKNGRSLLDAYLRYQRSEGKKAAAAQKAKENAAAASVGSRQDTAPQDNPDPVLAALERGLGAALR